MSDYPIDLPHAILFDMDGLLVDTEPYWLETERELMAEFGVQWQISDQFYCLGGPMEKVSRYMADLSRNSKSADWFANELVDRMARKFEAIALMPGIQALLQEILGLRLPCALVSASPRRLVDAVLDSLTAHPFALSISADDVECGKPYPDPYLKAAHLLEVDIQHSLIFEDSPTGVMAARRSGAWVIAVPHVAPIEIAPKSAILPTLANHSISSLWKLVREN
jgi:HAD superfamily hydrolase (TIGR01509 family)